MLPLIAASMSASVGAEFFSQQRGRRHDLAGLTIAALRNLQVDPRRLHCLGLFALQPFDGEHLPTGRGGYAA